MGTKGVITIVGEAKLELSDELWNENKDRFAAQLKAGVLAIHIEPKLTKEEQEEEDAAALAAAEKLIAEKKAAEKK